MRSIIKILIVFMLTVGMAYGLTPQAQAGLQDFTVTNFSADYYLDKSDPHGHMRVVETIDVSFTDYNHGILRAIPNEYDGHSLQISDIKTNRADGTPWPYSTYESSKNLVLKIGDPNNTVTGQNTFVVEYQLTGPISFYDSHDELFWNVNGDQWPQPFVQVISRLHLSGELASALQDRHKCFTGRYGSTAENCSVSVQKTGTETVITTVAKQLSPYETLSFVVAFDKGTFVPYNWQDEAEEHIKDIIFGAGILAVLAMAFRHWWRRGKDYSGSGIVVPEYSPPKGIDVLSAGILQDYMLDNKDITAGIISLAVRGYLKIIEEDNKKMLFFKSRKYSLILVNQDISKLNKHESRLLGALFSPFKIGQKLELGTYNSKLQKTTMDIGNELTEQLTKDGYFDDNPKKSAQKTMIVYFILVIAMIIGAFILGAVIAGGFGVVAVAVMFILLSLMPRRSKMGVATHEQLKGLKYYIQMTEKDRIKFMQGPNAKYAKNAREPKRTIHLFEKLLPYAIIFGAEKQWAKEFNDLYQTPPEWYQGNYTTFNTVVLTNHIMNSTSAMTTSFAPPSSSGSSGFSGGGGAGGGGGGGGGGGW